MIKGCLKFKTMMIVGRVLTKKTDKIKVEREEGEGVGKNGVRKLRLNDLHL